MRRRKQSARGASAPQRSLVPEDGEQDQQRSAPLPRLARCKCGAELMPGKAFCAVCFTEISKLWTTPPSTEFGLCREGD